MSYTPSEEDIRFHDLREQYEERFDDSYGIAFGFTEDWPLEKHIELMEKALRTGVPIDIRKELGLGDPPDLNGIVL